METKQAIENRHSRRAFQAKPVEQDKIVQLLDAARLAPSAINRQPWHYVVVQEKEQLRRVVGAEAFYNKWLGKAPVLIIACVTEGKWAQIDLGLSIENLLLRATDLGLGSIPTAVSNKGKLAGVIGCPKEFSPAITIAIGYAQEKKTLGEKAVKVFFKGKKPLSEIASREEFGVPM